jgi:hypothetical protein
MARSGPTAPTPLTSSLFAASASPSSSNRRAPPSMSPPSLHRRPVASLTLGTYKRHLGRASPRRTPHRLLSSSLMSELTPTACLQSLRFAVVTWQLHRRFVSGEGTLDTATSPSPSSASCGDRQHAVSLAHCTLVGTPPHSWPHHHGPRWTEPPTWSTGHGPSLPIIQCKNNSVCSKEKTISTKRPLLLFEIKPQSNKISNSTPGIQKYFQI